MPKTTDNRIASVENVSSPEEVAKELPSTEAIENLVVNTRQSISNILHGKDPRLLVVVGPCSIHNIDAAEEYGKRLLALREQHKNELEVVMRVYFEKPRTTVGWKGLINDPDLDESFHINKGIRLARKLLVDLNAMGMPAGSEFLDIVTGQYYSDLISWGAIGARTTESQVHRELASGLSCPVGFKNGTDGNIKIAQDAIQSARNPHIFLSPTQEGTTAIYRTTGNADAHIILRGGKEPNYEETHVKDCIAKLESNNIDAGIVIDFSHANSRKKFEEQVNVGRNIATQIAAGQTKISGVMIESHLVEGRQDVVDGKAAVFGQSITDACLGWDATESLLGDLAKAVSQRNC